MQDQQLIAQLKELKKISPRKEWVVLSKNEILGSQASFTGFWENISSMIFSKKYAYAFAALAVLMVGSVAMMQFPGNSSIPIASPAALVEAQNNVETFKVKSKELAMVAQNDPKSFSTAVDDVKMAAKQLTETIQKEPALAKEVALEVNNNKTYLAVAGTQVKETSDTLYRTIVEQMVSDLQKTSLTKSQEESLGIARDLYKKERYADALESILLLSMAIKSN